VSWKNVFFALVLPLVVSGTPGSATLLDAMNDPSLLIDFKSGNGREWFVINDVVMGGVSKGSIQFTDRGTGVFAGMLSMDNNGGFASVRTAFDSRDLSPYAGLAIRVRGDGRSYQLRLRNDEGFEGIAYRAYFDTRKGEWITVRIPFSQFLPTFRGRTLRDAPPLDTSRIRQLGFLLADGKPGHFSLEIDFVRALESVGAD
jgi:monofunctional biosynthetic peptidoglycan transglycosylase